MQFLPTAFTQLFFAWKLYNYALDGQISRDALDITLTFQSDDRKMILVLPDRIFENDDDFILAFENNLSIAFGAAAITLDRSREEVGHRLPNSIETEAEHCIALGPVDIHRMRMTVAPMWIIASKLVSVLHARMAMRLNSLSF